MTETVNDNENPAPIEERIKDAKQRLRKVLSLNHGVTSHPDVLAVIQELASMNPTVVATDTDTATATADENDSSTSTSTAANKVTQIPPSRSPLLIGKWKTISSPAFPNRIPPEEGKEDIFQYTLGRISFNIFQPNDLICTLGQILSPIDVLEWDDETEDQDEDEGKGEGSQESKTAESSAKEEPVRVCSVKRMTYPVIFPMTIHTPKGDLDAVMKMEGEAHASTDERIKVRFDAGTLSPSPELVSSPEKMELWKETFAGAYAKADSERGYISGLFRYAIQKVLSVTFPTDESAAASNNSFRYEMKRAPKGFLDVIYLDNDLRITRGNRGSYVVVERVE